MIFILIQIKPYWSSFSSRLWEVPTTCVRLRYIWCPWCKERIYLMLFNDSLLESCSSGKHLTAIQEIYSIKIISHMKHLISKWKRTKISYSYIFPFSNCSETWDYQKFSHQHFQMSKNNFNEWKLKRSHFLDFNKLF